MYNTFFEEPKYAPITKLLIRNDINWYGEKTEHERFDFLISVTNSSRNSLSDYRPFLRVRTMKFDTRYEVERIGSASKVYDFYYKLRIARARVRFRKIYAR